MNDKQLNKMNDLEISFQKQLNESDSKNAQLQNQLNEQQNKMNDLEASFQKQLNESDSKNDTTKSKVIVSTSNAQTLGSEVYEDGEQITSLHMSTAQYLHASQANTT